MFGRLLRKVRSKKIEINCDDGDEATEPCLQDHLDRDIERDTGTDPSSVPKLTSSVNRYSMVSHSGRALVKTLLRLFLKLIISLWKLASSFAIIIFFASWYYGGFLPYVVVIIALLSLGYHFSDTLLYQPETPSEARVYVPSPSQFGLPYESVHIQTSDRVKLHAYLIKHAKPTGCPVLIYFHGNAGNIGHRLDNARQLYNKLQCNILLVEYRGYGLSEGSPSESGFYRDAEAAFTFVQNRDDLDSRRIILFGRSLGGAVAIDLASRCNYRDRIMGLIVENTFTSIPSLARHLFPVRIVRYLPNWCYKNRYESAKKVVNVTCPSLFISGLKDDLIPPHMMIELHGRCTAMKKELVQIPLGSHNDTWTVKGYLSHVTNFVTQVVEQGPLQGPFVPPPSMESSASMFSDNIV